MTYYCLAIAKLAFSKQPLCGGRLLITSTFTVLGVFFSLKKMHCKRLGDSHKPKEEEDQAQAGLPFCKFGAF